MTKYDNIADIPTDKYQGYIWESDNKKPQVLDGSKMFNFSTIVPDSYILEALLYCKDEKKAIHIRHSGREHIYEFDLKSLPEKSELVDAEYLPHRLENVEKVLFKQLWIPKKDPLCEDKPVLIMKALIFTGFEMIK